VGLEERPWPDAEEQGDPLSKSLRDGADFQGAPITAGGRGSVPPRFTRGGADVESSTTDGARRLSIEVPTLESDCATAKHVGATVLVILSSSPAANAEVRCPKRAPQPSHSGWLAVPS
jgi:hypothetical protein